MDSKDFYKSCVKPTLILHGGAGAITRANLPPKLYQMYHKSLISYLKATKSRLDDGISALDAACYAVSLMEDDPLFNCGRGSVFTTEGTIEMEASVMVTSINEQGPPEGAIKRAAAVSLIRRTRHPILLAKEVLINPDDSKGLGGTSTMHCHLSGADVERWGQNRGLELKDTDWFWTKRRWDEHRRGLQHGNTTIHADDSTSTDYYQALPSQGTVGAVCLDSHGNLAVATSTGGLTNKAPGRIGDTPTVGAGFWAESWIEEATKEDGKHSWHGLLSSINLSISSFSSSCLPRLSATRSWESGLGSFVSRLRYANIDTSLPRSRRRAIAMSGTGNGDSFLRTNAARSTAAICRYSSGATPLAEAITDIAGRGGELQRSAGQRWNRTGEGQGGIIGIEVCGESSGKDELRVDVVFDFNCGGLWRAWYCEDKFTGEESPKVMVFRDEY